MSDVDLLQLLLGADLPHGRGDDWELALRPGPGVANPTPGGQRLLMPRIGIPYIPCVEDTHSAPLGTSPCPVDDNLALKKVGGTWWGWTYSGRATYSVGVNLSGDWRLTNASPKVASDRPHWSGKDSLTPVLDLTLNSETALQRSQLNLLLAA
jgi:hypothetical protein